MNKRVFTTLRKEGGKLLNCVSTDLETTWCGHEVDRGAFFILGVRVVTCPKCQEMSMGASRCSHKKDA